MAGGFGGAFFVCLFVGFFFFFLWFILFSSFNMSEKTAAEGTVWLGFRGTLTELHWVAGSNLILNACTTK